MNLDDVAIKLAPAERYVIPPGSELVRVRDISSDHRGRLVEIREAETGEGHVGVLDDAIMWLINDACSIRFRTFNAGWITDPDDVVLVHPVGQTIEALTAYYTALAEEAER